MAVIGIGLDVVEVPRARGMLERLGARLLARVLTEDEHAYVTSLRDPVPALAARLAAKEAVYKALQVLPGARCPALSGEIVTRPGPAFAETFKAWLDDGVQDGPTARDRLLQQIRDARTDDEFTAAWKAIGVELKAGAITRTQADDLAAAYKAAKPRPVTEEQS